MQPALPNSLSLAANTKPLHHTLIGRAGLIIAATGFVALCAHVSLPLLFTPVPLTLQPFAVLLVGLLLGPTAAFSAMVLYLAEGAAGLPVFSPTGPGGVAQLLGPTAGFLFSYPFAAAAAGAIARPLAARLSRFAAALIAGAAFTLILFTCGATWLAHLLHLSPAAAWTLAVAPFLLGEVIKVTAAAGIFSSAARFFTPGRRSRPS